MRAATGGAAALSDSAPAGSERSAAPRPAARIAARSPASLRLLATTLCLFTHCLFTVASVLGPAPAAAGEPPGRRAEPAGAPHGSAEPLLLEPGRPVDLRLGGGENRTFAFDLGAGRYARVVVEQRGIDVVAVLVSPHGETLVVVDGPDGPEGPERVSALAGSAAEAGRFRLEVRSLYPEDPAGELTVLLAEERSTLPGDPDVLTAERLGAEAAVLWGRGDGESLRGAIGRFEETLAAWQRLGDRRREAETATHLGYLHRQLGELHREVERFEQALPQWRELGDEARQAELLNNLGLAYGRLGETERGLAASQEAAALFHELGDRLGEGAALNTIGHALLRIGADLDRARDFLERSLVLRRDTGDRRGEGRTLNGLGRIHLRRGEYAAAIEAFETALAGARAAEDREGERSALVNLSSAYGEIGEPERSIEHYQEVLHLSRQVGDLRGEAYALHNIGGLYVTLGEAAEGISYFYQALDLFARIGEAWAEAGTLDAIGSSLLRSGRPGEALVYVERGLAAARGLGDRMRESLALSKLAQVRVALGDPGAALDPAREAVAVAVTSGIRPAEATARRALAEALLALGEPEAALEALAASLAIERETGSPPGEAQCLLQAARAERMLGRLDEARRLVEAALEVVESIRTAVTATHLRATYLASKQEYYEEWISLLMALHRSDPGGGWAARSLAGAERARARSLLDALVEVGAEIRADLDPALATEEESLRHRLNARELGRQQATEAGDLAAAATAALEIQTLTAEYHALEARLRTTNPRYADLALPEPLDAAAIQGRVLDRTTLLLQYSLGEEASWLWAVTPSSLETFELPPRARIEELARRAYDLLTARNREPEGESPEERRRRIAEADAAYPGVAAELSEVLLAPARDRLSAAGVERVVVVADGALHYVPFAALPRPGSSEPLLFGLEVANVPSASVLDVLRREQSGRHRAARALAVIADPVFDAADPRVEPAVAGADRLAVAAAPGAGGDGLRGGSYRRLRFSRREADLIAGLVPAEQRWTALDFAASLEAVAGGALVGYRLVHFATHGVLNTEYPALSGLVLSLVDERGAPREGFLRMHDIYDLELDADLVTLSACETALGREIRGEGLVGLARGFMYAGASRVVASLWSVQDRATAETMRRFYQGMLDRGLTPAAALRETQASMAREERWAAPYYWAPFVLHGEWR